MLPIADGIAHVVDPGLQVQPHTYPDRTIWQTRILGWMANCDATMWLRFARDASFSTGNVTSRPSEERVKGPTDASTDRCSIHTWRIEKREDLEREFRFCVLTRLMISFRFKYSIILVRPAGIPLEYLDIAYTFCSTRFILSPLSLPLPVAVQGRVMPRAIYRAAAVNLGDSRLYMELMGYPHNTGSACTDNETPFKCRQLAQIFLPRL